MNHTCLLEYMYILYMYQCCISMWMCGARTEAQGLAVIALRFAKGSVESTHKVPTSQAQPLPAHE